MGNKPGHVPKERDRETRREPLSGTPEWYAEQSGRDYSAVHNTKIARQMEALQARRDLLFEKGEAYKRTRIVAIARECAFDQAMAECRRLGYYTPPTIRGGKLTRGRYEWELFYEEPEEYGG